MPEWFDEAVVAGDEWCAERSPWPRAPLLLFMVYVSVRHLTDADYSSVLGGLNLGIHEAGHLLFSWLAWDFLTVLGGTLLQLGAPVVSAWMFARQPDYFACAFCGSWLATNLYNVATYMADARELDLPLVNVGGGEVDHDWSFMLSAVGLLDFDTRLAAVVRLLTFVIAWTSIGAGGWMLVRMFTANRGRVE
jgi:hypothetical protein